MKIKVSIELDIPEIKDEKVDLKSIYSGNMTWEEAFLRQHIFDDFINFATTSHLRDAVKWMAKSGGDTQTMEHKIAEHHKEWAAILDKAQATMDIEKVIELPEDEIVHDPSDFGLTRCGIDRTRRGMEIHVSSKLFNCPKCLEGAKRGRPEKYNSFLR